MSQIKSKQRVADHGEVFTRQEEVNAMLDLIAQRTLGKIGIETTFLEPACGTGNFLMEILQRKLAEVKVRFYRKSSPQSSQREYEFNAILAISSLYGIELLKDNVTACRENLYSLFHSEYSQLYPDSYQEACLKVARFLLNHNILHGDALKMVHANGQNEPVDNDFLHFSQWSGVTFPRKWSLKRHDYVYQKLIEQGGKALDQNGEPYRSIQEYFPCYFLEIENATPRHTL